MEYSGFEWDPEKAAANFIKHGVMFETAVKVFNDVNRLEYIDEGHSEREDRIITIGMAGKVLFVVFTERGSRARIISARLANRKEKEIYEYHLYSGDGDEHQ